MKSVLHIPLIFVVIAITLSSASANIPKLTIPTLPTQQAISGRIEIRAPDIAENGAVVPVSIQRVLLDGSDAYVAQVWFFNKSRNKIIAHFELGPRSLATGLSTRVKLGRTGSIYVYALLSDGTFLSGEKVIKVTMSGCGGGNYTASENYTPPPSLSTIRQPQIFWQNNERYEKFDSNGVTSVSKQAVSTFSIDVDTGSYTNVRRFLEKNGQLPVADAVRVEEMINYFRYDYPRPSNTDKPFEVITEIGPNPWNKNTSLLHIGIQGYEVSANDIPPSNLVFLIDVSGSMRNADKLELLKSSLKMLAHKLRATDRIAIAVYAGASGVVLEPTSGANTDKIIRALSGLSAGGSTNGGQGIQLAYSLARQSFIPNGVNRVILATDGDFNVGLVNQQQLIDLIQKQRDSGISLTTLGFGSGNYNDHLMEQLADEGNGNYAYIDSLREAKKVLVNEMSGTLYTIASDVKVQVEFNPAIVSEYRLIGYENRLLRQEDFRNDKVDAGDLGAGHSVTALYEVSLHSGKSQRLSQLRYQDVMHNKPNQQGEIAYVRLRYKTPRTDVSHELGRAVRTSEQITHLSQTSEYFRFSAAVAAFGQALRGSTYLEDMKLADIRNLAQGAYGLDAKGNRREFVKLVSLARTFQTKAVVTSD